MRLLRTAPRHGAGRSRPQHQRCACCLPASPAGAGASPPAGLSVATMAHLSSSSSSASASAAAADGSAAAAVLARVRKALPNGRDLSEAFPAIPPGRVVRCANPASTSPEDAAFLLRELRVRDLIDLRAGEEIQEDDPGSVLMAATSMRLYARGWLTPGQLFVRPDPLASAATSPRPATAASTSASAASTSSTSPPAPSTSPPTPSTSAPSTSAPSPPPAAAPLPTATRHHISLLDRGRYYLALAARIPAATTAAALLTNIVSKPAARRLLLPYVNGGGLPLLYEMLLESSRPEMRQVMEVLLAAAERRHAVLFFCRAGKDRTGLVAAAVLAVAGASEQQIIEDYARSDALHRVALAGLESREELAGLDMAAFERAPPEVMAATLAYVRRRYGSLAGYLDSVGFGRDKQERLRAALTGADW
ncbi:hypothetical protein CHLRE_03g165300v5 [Chlamydomonas reinhardtii]|uniref:Tyrosine specific protein phosphatases domain-containing protein n=1 Tax=Chlamydomonas reinhardtii TaxID=3055 RepID=A0A2K3DWN7_CHLRE|nr:uncharacterized protein CHLRE_03g165300v5 [Chlamydomonas reinhardtii]PNW84950.1 hypothetical protein CHLRE_03g165300v5 [Chlamydomonas reinhardtii]